MVGAWGCRLKSRRNKTRSRSRETKSRSSLWFGLIWVHSLFLDIANPLTVSAFFGILIFDSLFNTWTAPLDRSHQDLSIATRTGQIRPRTRPHTPSEVFGSLAMHARTFTRRLAPPRTPTLHMLAFSLTVVPRQPQWRHADVSLVTLALVRQCHVSIDHLRWPLIAVIDRCRWLNSEKKKTIVLHGFSRRFYFLSSFSHPALPWDYTSYHCYSWWSRFLSCLVPKHDCFSQKVLTLVLCC